MKAAIVLPAFNESAVIYKILKSLPKRLEGISEVDVVVVNDGSQDSTLTEAARAGTNVISHSLNRGVGAATKTGIYWAKKNKADVIVTFDADGQHNPRDIQKIIKPIIDKKADVVIGSRFKRRSEMPPDRFLLNLFANLATFILFGVFSTDSQSGLRAFSKKAASLIDTRLDRMDFSSEVLLEAKRHDLKVLEVPTSVIYTSYSRAKGQKNTNALPILARLLVKLLR